MEVEHLPVKMGRPKRTERLAVAERDSAVATMAARGVPYADIADEFGFASTGGVANAIKRAHEATRAKGGEEHKLALLSALDALAEDAWRDIENPGPKVSNSGLVVSLCTTCTVQLKSVKGSAPTCPLCGGTDGEIVKDRAARSEARNLVLKVERTRAEVLGLFAPKKSVTASLDDVLALKELAGQVYTVEAEVISEED